MKCKQLLTIVNPRGLAISAHAQGFIVMTACQFCQVFSDKSVISCRHCVDCRRRDTSWAWWQANGVCCCEMHSQPCRINLQD